MNKVIQEITKNLKVQSFHLPLFCHIRNRYRFRNECSCKDYCRGPPLVTEMMKIPDEDIVREIYAYIGRAEPASRGSGVVDSRKNETIKVY